MNPDDLARILDELGQRLGPTGERVFALAVRQVYIDSILGAVTCGMALIVLLIAAVVAARYTVRAWQTEVGLYAEGKGRWSRIQAGPDKGDYLFPWVMCGFGGGVAAVFLLAGFVSSLARLLNPEYAALRDLIGAIR